MSRGEGKLGKRYILDAGILLLFFAGKEKARVYIDKAYSEEAKVFMCEVNVAEFIYNYAKIFGWESTKVKHDLLRNSPIEIIGVSEDLTLEASKLKLKHYNILSLADCYLIAVAKKLRAVIVTTDSMIKEVKEMPTILLKMEQT